MASSSQPSFLGIGGQKCGSTWLAECLRYHPEVFMSSPKELFFFSNEEVRARGMAWYLSHFQAAAGYEAVGEFSAAYLVNAHPDDIRATLGPVRIVVSLRHPVERFVSHYKHLVRGGDLPAQTRLDGAIVREAVTAMPSLLKNGAYAGPVQRYIDTFGFDALHIILKDDLDRDPAGVARALYTFLRVDPAFQPPVLYKTVSPGIVPRFASLERLRRRLYAHAGARAPGMIDLVRRLRLAEAYRRINAAPRRAEPALTDEAAGWLLAYYRSDVDRLERMLGRSLDAWRSRPQPVNRGGDRF